MSPHVSILMSTYNGEAFLAEQIDSILKQSHRELELLIRDDGSRDGTLALVERYAHKDGRVRWLAEDNLGVTRSFFRLLGLARDTSAYYALCDQDDYWLRNKLRRAVATLERCPSDVPAMYFSRLRIVDENLRPSRQTRVPALFCLENALVENFATGCTIVLNRAARDLVLRNLPRECCMHDWWIYLLVLSKGRVFYDAYAGILYRQHGRNSVGYDRHLGRRLVQAARRLLAREVSRFDVYTQIVNFLEFARREGLPDEIVRLCEDVLRSRHSIAARLGLVLRNGGVIWQANPRGTIEQIRYLVSGALG
ncbi:glycosyltransferase involved in cell wall biosynthesis [Plasticicumulans lactativorans]|uniref:Glycosyltransferase involved in cell wall biosynthesis n=1 Tax=Plasticicumulans lactativorans TaxID=1133106 RepID=A0A4R2LCE5_9GAMM|nr:glycosyltransferase family 2 protein [Plasticicumulans lactativorans]TCO80518.1 glycosyltransferase involved in cell wall biosynthesis [Plasticicumulans lactativorans]